MEEKGLGGNFAAQTPLFWFFPAFEAGSGVVEKELACFTLHG